MMMDDAVGVPLLTSCVRGGRGERRWARELGLAQRSLWGGGPGQEAEVEALMQWSEGLLEEGRAHHCVRVTQQLAAACQSKGARLVPPGLDHVCGEHRATHSPTAVLAYPQACLGTT
jgi:hypothetical protein